MTWLSDEDRSQPIIHERFGCIFSVGDKNFDCRLLLDGMGDSWPGQRLVVPIKFLDPEHARKEMTMGRNFQLTEGKIIARGVITHIAFNTSD